jgi:hypothetical protein
MRSGARLMRPYPDELLRSLRESMREVVIPAIEEPWPRYVAKAIEKLLEHLELRALHEDQFLSEDIEELDELFEWLRARFAEPPLASSTALLAWCAGPGTGNGGQDELEPGDGGTKTRSGLQALNEANEARRRHLVAAIEAMDEAERDDALRSSISACRDHVRAYLRRELDRDVLLARPTFMSFGPPIPRAEGAGQ